MKKAIMHISLILCAGNFFISCSTTRCIPPGSERLAENKVTIDKAGKMTFSASDISPYIKQKAVLWSPLMCVYNWENGKGKGWDNFVHKMGTAPTVFDSTQIEISSTNIRHHLEYLGYYSSLVEPSIKRYGKRKVSVDYHIIPGKRYPIRSREYVLDLPGGDFSEDFCSDTLLGTVKAGDFLCEKTLEEESSRSAENLRNKGYYDFNKNFFFFDADTLSHPDSADLRIIIRNKTRNEAENMPSDMADSIQRTFRKYKFGKIDISYPSDLKIRPKVLTDLSNISSSQPYSERRASILYDRYSSISLFNSVNVELTPRDTLPIVDCTINLSKGRMCGFKVGLEASINSNYLFGISPELSFFHKNLFRGGEVLTVSLRSNNQMKFNDPSVKSNEFGVSANLSIPRFLPFKTSLFKGPNLPKTEAKVSFNYQNRPEFTRNMFKGSFGYKGVYRRQLYYFLTPLSVNYVHMSQIDSTFEKSLQKNPFLKNAYEDHLDAGMTTTLYYSSTPSFEVKESSWYARLQLDLSGNLLSAFGKVMRQNSDGRKLILNVPYSQYIRADLQLVRTLVWGRNSGFGLAMRLRGGIGHAYGNSSSLPFEKHFFCGGASSMRGWTARTLGPGSTAMETRWVIPNQTGDMQLEANAEFRFKIVWKLQGALFVDAGNVWDIGQGSSEQSRFSFSSIAADLGYGLRADLSFIVLRLDLGMRMRDPSLASPWIPFRTWMNKGNYAIHFGVGYPF